MDEANKQVAKWNGDAWAEVHFSVPMNRPNHCIGVGYIEALDEALEKKIANMLCRVFGNAPRGYLRVYVRDKQAWVGPHILKAELVVLTA